VNTRALSLLLALAFATVLACDDPVHDAEVDALGPENGTPGPKHRPGQPCLTCHGGSGPGSAHYAIAGTVYTSKLDLQPLSGCDVELTDSRGETKHAISNDAGNFYLTSDEWQPIAPIHVKLTYLQITAEMGTHIGRDGSCADCHFDPQSAGSPGHVFLVADTLPGAGP
jgi:hypothetical protein